MEIRNKNRDEIKLQHSTYFYVQNDCKNAQY